jgi:hypothetical protein
MKPLFWAFVLALVTPMLIVLASAAEAEDYPIQWTEYAGLNSLDEIEAILDQRGEGQTLERYDRRSGRVDKRHVENCNEFLAAVDDGWYANGTRLELGQFAWARASCGFLSRLRTAKPAKRSFVRNFTLRETAPDYLPARLEFDLWTGEQHGCEVILEKYPAAKRDGLSWAAFHRLLHNEYWKVEYPNQFEDASSGIQLVQATSPNSASYSDQPDNPYSRVNIEIWARADFNDDAVEDIFMVVGSAITILTRESADAVLSYVEAPLIDDAALCNW